MFKNFVMVSHLLHNPFLASGNCSFKNAINNKIKYR